MAPPARTPAMQTGPRPDAADRRKREPLQGNRRRPRSQRWGRDERPRPSGLLLGVRLRQRPPQQSAHFFLDIDNNRGFTQLLGEALILPAELLHFLFLWVAFGLGAALVRGQALENAGLPFATPGDQVRGVQTLAAKQRADGPRLNGGRIGLGQNAQFVFAGEAPALGVRDNLRVRSWRGGRLGRDGLACRRTSVGLASLVLPTFRGRQDRRRSRRDSVVLHIDSRSRPTQ